jgi:PhzF family phenazine biosynthesis protein
MQLKVFQVDAFTGSLFKGNPAAVVILEEEISDELMQNIAFENNLSETAYILINKTPIEIRWFSPTAEVDLCGHATLASAKILFDHYLSNKQQIIFDSKSGELAVTQSGNLLTLNFPSDAFKKVDNNDEINQAANTCSEEIYKGRDDYLVILESEEELKKLTPNFQQVSMLDARGLIVSAPSNSVDFVSRCFFPQLGVNEDPVTGSAHTLLMPYWSNRLGRNKLTAKQASERGGLLQCEYKGTRTLISGEAVIFLTGVIEA